MQLLISVRNQTEALVARRHGIRRIDLKEPAAGSLGAASPAVWEEVLQKADHTLDVSLALGELSNFPSARLVPTGISAVKVGLSGCRHLREWPERLAAVYAPLPAEVARVAVYYADRTTADCPELSAVLDTAQAVGCRILLIDTFNKSCGSLVDLAEKQQVIQWRLQVHQAGLQLALGGSLRREHLAWVARVGPDIVAVRGDVCGTDRRGNLCPKRLADWITQWNKLPAVTPIEPGAIGVS